MHMHIVLYCSMLHKASRLGKDLKKEFHDSKGSHKSHGAASHSWRRPAHTVYEVPRLSCIYAHPLIMNYPPQGIKAGFRQKFHDRKCYVCHALKDGRKVF